MQLTRRIFFVLFGLTALVAVGSFWAQLPGLVGRNGVAPAGQLIDALHRANDLSFWELPTLAWLSSADWLLHVLCALGVASSLALILGLGPRLACLVLWASWLSLTQVCHPFLDFQWDILLTEAAFFAALYAPGGWRGRWEEEPLPVARFLMAWLACKVTLESGLVKLGSGDPAWRDLTALTYHWWTQPLPTWSSHLFAALPLAVQKALCAAMFVLELPIPLMALGPRRLRLVSAVGLMALQAGLFAAGNYSYYNVLTFVLAVPLLDDAALERVLPSFFFPSRPVGEERMSPAGWMVALLVVALGAGMFTRRSLAKTQVGPVLSAVARFETINAYGAFAWMTKTRPEILIEGTVDGVEWREYEFPYKPGRLDRRPVFVAPWQPRLDWQMWFAALGECSENPWLLSTQRQLLLGVPEVLALFETNPFPDGPPKVIRTRTFEYRFAPWSEAGVWWTRTETGPYCPPLMLGPGGQLIRAP
ncbi:MAG: membrane protein [Myxococcaceae bacterium]